MTAALETKALSKQFGGFTAVAEVALRIQPGERHALIGPNGAGKTTLINLLTGALGPSSGRVLLHGEDVTALPQHARVARGLARTFQVNQLFPALTPLESVIIAAGQKQRLSARWWGPTGSRSAAVEAAAALLDQFGLLDVADLPTASLAYGKQRLLEIALALACEPRVLLLDEPAAGVPEAEAAELVQTIAALPPSVTVLLIEHDMNLVFRFAQRISVLVGGAVAVQGTPEAIAADPRVREVYLGDG